MGSRIAVVVIAAFLLMAAWNILPLVTAFLSKFFNY